MVLMNWSAVSCQPFFFNEAFMKYIYMLYFIYVYCFIARGSCRDSSIYFLFLSNYLYIYLRNVSYKVQVT